jgi:hypothetical protein
MSITEAAGERRTAKAGAMGFLQAALAGGPAPAAELSRRACEHGLTPKAIRSAREALAVKRRACLVWKKIRREQFPSHPERGSLCAVISPIAGGRIWSGPLSQVDCHAVLASPVCAIRQPNGRANTPCSACLLEGPCPLASEQTR